MARRLMIAIGLGGAILLGLGVIFLTGQFGVWHAASHTLSRTVSGVWGAVHPTGEPGGALHYSPNGNFDERGAFLPARAGFNVADIADPAHLKSLPDGVRVLVWVGQCDGVSKKFINTVRGFLGDRRIFGYYLMDDPDPRSLLGTPPRCPPARLKEESDWLHKHAPGTKTVIVLMNLSNAKTPSYKGTYNTGNSGVDLFGLSAYPCRTELKGCDRDLIRRFVAASDLAGIPRSHILPIYQAFGGGRWRDDAGGSFIMPNAAEEIEIINEWRTLIPNPVLDTAYSWGKQSDDLSLNEAPSLQAVFSNHNKRKP